MLVGKSALQNVALVTTKWRIGATYEERQLEVLREHHLKTKYWKSMTARGTYVESHDGSAKSARRIVTLLRDKPRIMFQNTGEIIVENMTGKTPIAQRPFNNTARKIQMEITARAMDKSEFSVGPKAWLGIIILIVGSSVTILLKITYIS